MDVDLELLPKEIPLAACVVTWTYSQHKQKAMINENVRIYRILRYYPDKHFGHIYEGNI